MWGCKGREGQRRREDKSVLICLFNWLKCSEESCAVIPAVRLDRVQAPGFRPAQREAAEGGPSALPQEADGVAGRSPRSEAAFASPAFQKFKTGMR